MNEEQILEQIVTAGHQKAQAKLQECGVMVLGDIIKAIEALGTTTEPGFEPTGSSRHLTTTTNYSDADCDPVYLLVIEIPDDAPSHHSSRSISSVVKVP